MGSLIFQELQKDYDVVGIDRNDDINEIKDVSLVIDFASHESSVTSARFCNKRRIPIIIGSTGQTEEENKIINEISKNIKLVKKSNFSSGIRVLEKFIEEMVKLSPEKIEIIEKHHKHKKDSPSGTAVELEKVVRRTFGGMTEIKSIREGENMGEHRIVAYFGGEKIEMKHNAESRNIFVQGVLKEVKNLLN